MGQDNPPEPHIPSGRLSLVAAILLVEQIQNQLRLVVYPIIYKVLYIRGGVGFLPSTLSWRPTKEKQPKCPHPNPIKNRLPSVISHRSRNH